MRRAARTDTNHQAIVEALRQVGATVQSLAPVGKGCPDLLVGFYQENYLLEVKDGSKKPSAQKLTHDETKWHADWRGSVHIVHSAYEALLVIGVPEQRAQYIAEAFEKTV